MPLSAGQTLTAYELPLASVATQVTDTCSFEITVADTTPPVVTCPDDVTAEILGPLGGHAMIEVHRADDEERLRRSEHEARESHTRPCTPSARRPASQGSSPR